MQEEQTNRTEGSPCLCVPKAPKGKLCCTFFLCGARNGIQALRCALSMTMPRLSSCLLQLKASEQSQSYKTAWSQLHTCLKQSMRRIDQNHSGRSHSTEPNPAWVSTHSLSKAVNILGFESVCECTLGLWLLTVSYILNMGIIVSQESSSPSLCEGRREMGSFYLESQHGCHWPEIATEHLKHSQL
jgi:hypothetical protein